MGSLYMRARMYNLVCLTLIDLCGHIVILHVTALIDNNRKSLPWLTSLVAPKVYFELNVDFWNTVVVLGKE